MGLIQLVLDILFNKLWKLDLLKYKIEDDDREEVLFFHVFDDANYEAGFGWLSIRLTRYTACGDQYWNLRIGTGDYGE